MPGCKEYPGKVNVAGNPTRPHRGHLQDELGVEGGFGAAFASVAHDLRYGVSANGKIITPKSFSKQLLKPLLIKFLTHPGIHPGGIDHGLPRGGSFVEKHRPSLLRQNRRE